MRSRNASGMAGSTLMGLAIGVAAGLATGLLAAPMRGGDMRATIRRRAADGNQRLQSLASSTRGWAKQTLDLGWQAVEEGRRAFKAHRTAATPRPLTASIGDVASRRAGTQPPWEARS
jgi:gas vesicle protein